MDKATTNSTPREDQSTLKRDDLKDLHETIRQLYLSDGRPWVVGFSGGKDSTAALQSVWYALQKLPKDQLNKPVYIISSDTLVETPMIVGYLHDTIDRINRSAKEQGLPFEAHEVSPAIDDTFWVKMIGHGYPAPSTRFRWCTDRLKIQPTSRFIQETISVYGEVVIILGARSSESASRSQVIEKRKKKRGESLLSRHSRLAGAWIYTPIEQWTRRDVWDYLLAAPSPWGNRNRDLVTMYKNAEGECPLVMEKNTQPCGNSRFGCWTCTLVDKDKSMEAMFDNGEDWLEPLIKLRNWLYETRDPENKHKYRQYQRRTGKIQFWESDGTKKVIWGPYKMEVRTEILRRLLSAQRQAQADGPDSGLKLITDAELHKIRQIWRFEEGDWEDSVPKIYGEFFDDDFDWLEEDWSGLGGMEQSILHEVCEEHGVPLRLLTELFDAERKQHGMSRRTGIHHEIEKAMEKDWRSLEEALAAANASLDNSGVAGSSNAH
jgi:DNA sulfur modification protein DndC